MSDPVVPDPDSDDGFQKLLAELPEAWARHPVEGDVADIVGPFVRAAYGRGYMRGLDVEGPTRS